MISERGIASVRSRSLRGSAAKMTENSAGEGPSAKQERWTLAKAKSLLRLASAVHIKGSRIGDELLDRVRRLLRANNTLARSDVPATRRKVNFRDTILALSNAMIRKAWCFDIGIQGWPGFQDLELDEVCAGAKIRRLIMLTR